MEEIVDRMESNPVIRDTEVCITGQMQYLQYWLKLIRHSQQNKRLVAFDKIRKLALDAYNMLQKMMRQNDSYQNLTPIINEVETHLQQVKDHLSSYPKYDSQHAIVSEFIDLEDFYLDNEEETELAEMVPLLKPFDNETRFRVKNLQRF
jgi:DNA repair ATPase RecN